jgi:hypothetical protein
MGKRSVFALFVALALAVSFTAYAGETGSVSGTVKDGSGSPVPGATVKVSGLQMPAGRNTVSGGNGSYNFQKLLPGSYTVEASLQGLGKSSKRVVVSVDTDLQIELTLIQTATGEVVVTASLAEVDKKSAEVSANFTGTEIRQLPLARTYEGLLNLIPGAPATSDNGYVAVAGGTRQDNKYLIDGVNITNPAYGYLGVDTNELDIADFNIKTGGVTAEFGRASGAMINAVTKSGTNEIKGNLRVEARPASFVANKETGTTQDISYYAGAASLGFPILKDTLFGYASGRYYSETQGGQSATIGGITTTQPDTKIKKQDYFGKLTGFLGQSVLLNAGFRALPNKTDDGFNSIFDAASAAYKSDTTNYVWNVTGDWFVTKDTTVEAKYVHLTENDTTQAQNVLNDRPTTIDPLNPWKYGRYNDPARSGGNSGVYQFQNIGDEYRRDEVKLTASQFLDIGPTQNQLKIGAGFENTTYNLVRATNGWGQLSYQTCPSSVCGTSTPAVRARYYTLQPEQTGKARTYSGFIQDTLTWNRLSATLGVLFNKDDFAQVALDGTRYNFMTFRFGEQVQPRIGLVYNADLIKGDKFYTSYGEYANLDQKSTSRSFAPFRIREDQAYFDRTTGVYLAQQIRGSSAGKFIPQDLKPPYQQEWVIGYAAPVTREVTAEVYYQYRNLKDPFEDVPRDPDNYFGSFQAANLPWARRVYRGATLDVTKRYANGWYANLNYTYSKLFGNFDEEYDVGIFNTSSYLEDGPGANTFEPNRYGRLGQDRPHIFKLFASYDLPLGFSLGGFLRVQSGTAWQAQGSDPNCCHLRYLEPAGTRRLPTWTNFDLLAAYNFRLGGDIGLRLEARIQNLFNTQTAITIGDSNRALYLDDYVDGTPPRNLGPQGTSEPNPLFGQYTTFADPRRLLLTALLDF